MAPHKPKATGVNGSFELKTAID